MIDQIRNSSKGCRDLLLYLADRGGRIALDRAKKRFSDECVNEAKEADLIKVALDESQNHEVRLLDDAESTRSAVRPMVLLSCLP